MLNAIETNFEFQKDKYRELKFQKIQKKICRCISPSKKAAKSVSAKNI